MILSNKIDCPDIFNKLRVIVSPVIVRTTSFYKAYSQTPICANFNKICNYYDIFATP